jgi:DNA-binding GntR family transcriptional regulator
MIGLVEVEARRGTRIADLNPQITRYAVEALLPVVVESVRLVVTNATEAECEALDRSVSTPSAGALDLFQGEGLFGLVVQLLGNDRATILFDEVVPHLRRAWRIEAATEPVGLSPRERSLLVDAVASAAGDQAADVVRGWFTAQLEQADGANVDV